jgi:hypothetical protein
MNTVIRTLWAAVATLALYNEAKRAGLIDKAKPYFVKMREKICPDARAEAENAQ